MRDQDRSRMWGPVNFWREEKVPKFVISSPEENRFSLLQQRKQDVVSLWQQEQQQHH
jgi:hypothetical protein